MDQQDRQAIEGLFDKLARVEEQAPPPDDEAERLIGQAIARQPAAPYFMAQTIVVQEQALEAAQARIEELERGGRPEGERRGGFLGSMFGGGRDDRERRDGPWGRSPAENRGSGMLGGFGGGMTGGRGGGFLAGAAQTALGVTGGVLLGSAIADMFDGDEAAAHADAADGDRQGMFDTSEQAAQDDGGFQDASYGDEGGGMDLGGDW